MKRKAAVSLTILFLFLSSVTAAEIESIFRSEVSDLSVDCNYYLSWAKNVSENYFLNLEHSYEKQTFLFVDRAEGKQLIAVGILSPEEGVSFIGWDKVSTGNPTKSNHFHTPIGVFKHSTSIVGWRAKGTPNSLGIRGLGEKGMRIWDFGWQIVEEDNREIRLAMHATDPVHSEPNLGTRQSQGCIRISAKMNLFIDIYGIIDADYLEDLENPRYSWYLNPDIKPVSYPGYYLIVADSEITSKK